MKQKKNPSFWRWAIASIIFRLILIYFPNNLNLATRPEVSTPVTSLRRLAEGYWLTQSSMSPYAGSMYHGSPLLLSILGPLTMKKIEGQPYHLLCRDIYFLVAKPKHRKLNVRILVHRPDYSFMDKVSSSFCQNMPGNGRSG